MNDEKTKYAKQEVMKLETTKCEFFFMRLIWKIHEVTKGKGPLS